VTRTKKQNVRLVTANQVVAANITEQRRRRGWTQDEFAERLEKVLGERWSIAVVSAAERSVTGKRVREFSADELVALARVFEVPIGTLFLMSAEDLSTRLRVPDQTEGLDHVEVLSVAIGATDHEINRRAEELAVEAYESALRTIKTRKSPDAATARDVMETEVAIREIDASRAGRGRTAKSPFVKPEETR
jgi:transcriptional regulator with XRE-family HTH domain